MFEVAPRTPTPVAKGSKRRHHSNATMYTSPSPTTPSNLTPPPSTRDRNHVLNMSPPDTGHTQDPRLASTAVSSKIVPTTKHNGWRGSLPTPDQARELPEAALRGLVCEILPALGDARMELAHSKLQYHLLHIETREAAERAMVEHDMTRREVEFLRSESQVLQNRVALAPDPLSPLARVQQHLELAVTHGRELEAKNLQLQRRLKQAKKVIKHLDGKTFQLAEDNTLLRERIKDNRDHLNAMRAGGNHPLFTQQVSSIVFPPKANLFGSAVENSGTQDPLDALIFAGQVLNGERASVPASPISPVRALRRASDHIRSTQSLLSLPSTPNCPRPSTADNALCTPENQVVRNAHLAFSAAAAHANAHASYLINQADRDSTISASDDDEEDEREEGEEAKEVLSDDGIPGSQASKVASNMLRRRHGSVHDGDFLKRASPPEKFVQGIPTGRISKTVSSLGHYAKRAGSLMIDEQDLHSLKKGRMGEVGRKTMGLGIEVWPSPGG